MTQINQADLELFIEVCVCDGHDFGTITKLVRDEWPDCSVRDSITLTAQTLRTISDVFSDIAVGATARMVLAAWTASYPGVTLSDSRRDPA